MRVIQTIVVLLVIGISQATSPPVYQAPCPAYNECVHFYQCINGTINTDGSGLIDVRFRPKGNCVINGNGDAGVCCQIPVVPTPTLTCRSGQTCVDPKVCKADGNVNTDGSGLINVRGNHACYVDPASGVKGICCKLSPTVIDTCPGNAECVLSNQCSTKALGVNNNYVPYTQGGSWTQCHFPGAYDNTGICCEKPATPYTAATQCGVRNIPPLATRSHIYKVEAYFGEFPWQAIVFFSNYTFVCGATLIDSQWLVTGAHCVNGRYPHELKIRLGEWQVDRDDPLATVDVDIAQIIVHPQANAHNLHNDIALVKLRAPVAYQYHINRVCLPDQSTYFAQGTKCFASGWGKNGFDGQYQAILKSVDVPLVEHSYCQTQLRDTLLGSYFNLDSSFLCAGGEANKDVCTGDGGGPLVCQNDQSQDYYLVGITAWGINCGEAGVPGVYVDVPHFSEWIWQNID